VPVIGGWAEAIPAAADNRHTADTSRRTSALLNVPSLVGRGQPAASPDCVFQAPQPAARSTPGNRVL
jgi:hypothetical protein